jgi:hypothetical protein
MDQLVCAKGYLDQRQMAQHFADKMRSNALEPTARSMPTLSRQCYFFFPEAKLGCHPAVFWLGAAAIVLTFSFLGFLDSRLPFCSPLAMSFSLIFRHTERMWMPC